MLSTSTLMVRKKTFLELGGYNPALYAAEDLALSLAVHEMGRWHYFDEVLTTKYDGASDQIGFPPEGIAGHRLAALWSLRGPWGEKSGEWRGLHRKWLEIYFDRCRSGLRKKNLDYTENFLGEFKLYLDSEDDFRKGNLRISSGESVRQTDHS